MPNYTLGSTRVPLTQPDLTTFQNNGTVVLDSRRNRPLWFDGRFLAARDLEREQNYFLQRQADLGQASGFATMNGLLVDQGTATGTIVIHAGEGVTPAGEMVRVPSDLTVTIADLFVSGSLDAALGISASPQQPAQSRTGLFVIALQPVEYAANPISAYPTTVQGPRSSHPGDIVEATVVSLVPYPNPPTQAAPAMQQAALARQIFLTGNPAPLPDSLLPLAVVSMQQGAVSWINTYLVRRDLSPQLSGVRFGLIDPAAQQAFLSQYDTQLQAAVLVRQNSGQKANFAAKDYFQLLPPAGRFPLEGIDTGAFSHAFFPQQMDVRLSVIPSDELPALLADGMSLPPIDLTLPDAAYANLSVFALILVPVDGFAALKASLPETPLNPILPQVLANRSPLQLLQLYQGTVTVTPPTPVANSAWAAAIGSQTYGYYIRRRSDPHIVEFTVPSGVTLVSSENPAPLGTSVTLTAMISPGNATGSVEFFDGTTSLGTAPVAGGTASLSTSSLAVGTHPMTAVYGGDTTNAGSASAAIDQIIVKTIATVTVTSSANPSTVEQAVTFTATVTPSSATGSVGFLDGANSLGTVTLAGGPVSLPAVSSLSVGTHSITATYSGDDNTGGATSDALSQNVTKIPTTVAVSSSLNPAVLHQAVTLSATVSPSTATGSVQFRDGGVALGATTLSGGTASLPATTALAVGTHPITAVYSGDVNDAGSTSPIFVETVSKITTTTTLTPSPNPSTFGQTVTFSAAVAPNSATGSVQFVGNGQALGTGSLSGGTATLNVSSLAVGAHSVTAIYSGDANDAPSTSAAVTETVNKVPTTVTVSSSDSPSTVGQTVTFTAKVAPASATGSVQFLDGANALGSGAVSGGAATLAASSLTAGTHSITASFGGDGNNAAGVSSAFAQTVNIGTSSVVLSATPNPSTFGQTVTFTAQVSPASATGTVQLIDGSSGALLGSGTLSGGTGAVNIATLAVGAHSVTADYGGDAANGSSASNTVTQTVNKAPTGVTVSSSANPSNFGQSVTFTVKVSPPSATGSVTLVADGATSLGSAAVSGGTASFTVASLASGVHTMTANYGGDGNDAASTSAPFTQTVNKVVSNVTIATSNSQSLFGQPVIFTATVTPSSATGSVQFMEGATALGTGTVSGGVATLALSSLAVATHSITAVYGGDANDTSATSAPLSQFVLKAATTTSLTSSPNPSTLGQAIIFTATVAPASATGNVQFMDSAYLLGCATLSGGTATLSVSDRAAATHSITAVYSGDANFGGSTSNAIAQTVNKAVPSVTVTSSANPSQFGQAFTFTAKITPSSATGSVQFSDTTAPLGTGSVSNGVATLAVTTLTVGAHNVIAQYSGDSNNASASGSLAQTVTKTAASVVITSSLNPSTTAQAVTLTARVTPSTATGSIQFEDGGKPVGAVLQLTGGAASITFNTPSVLAVVLSLAAGTHPMTAVYSGDGNNAAATSQVFTQTVNNPIILTTAITGILTNEPLT